MDKEEMKNDIKEFNNLKHQIKSLYKELEELEKDNIELFSRKNKDIFVKALDSANSFVNNISNYFENNEKQIDFIECDYNKRRSRKTQNVIKEKKNHLDSMAEIVNGFIEKPKLKILFLEVTLRCNAKCEHCGSSCGYTTPKDEVSAEEIKKALLEIHQKYGAQNVFLTITGGEPLMRPDLFDIMKYAVDLGYHWGMTTNGMLITAKTIEKYRETNMESISVSLDGLEKTHESFRKVPGSFKKIMKAIDMLKGLETLKSFEITTVVNKKNIDELEDIYQLLLKKGVKEWRVMAVDPIGRANQNDELLLDKEGLIRTYNFIREKRLEGKINVENGCSHYLGLKYEGETRPNYFICGAGLFVGSILRNGDICVCPNVRREELIQGNIKTDSFVDVWENKFEIFRKKRFTVNDKCKKCKSFKYCRGDSLHTWNYEEKMPNMCMKDLLQEEFIE